MQIGRSQLEQAVSKGILAKEQAEKLWAFLQQDAQHRPSFRFNHILLYFGGLLAIGAMSVFMNLGWERFGGWGLLAIALCYLLFALWLTERLVNAWQQPVAAGVVAAFAVVLVPLAIYGLQNGLGYWPSGRLYRDYHVYLDWRWMFMELATLIAGCIMLWRWRLPFLVMPVAVTLWYISMDLTPMLFGQEGITWELRKVVSLWFGLAMVLLALLVDLRSSAQKDYAFWLYLFGVAAFWGGLSLMDSNSEWNKFFYFLINLLMIIAGAILSRRVFAVFGAIGSFGYLGHLAYSLFRDSLLFPFVLSAIGFAIVYLGILWQRHEHGFATRLPQALRTLMHRRQLR